MVLLPEPVTPIIPSVFPTGSSKEIPSSIFLPFIENETSLNEISPSGFTSLTASGASFIPASSARILLIFLLEAIPAASEFVSHPMFCIGHTMLLAYCINAVRTPSVILPFITANPPRSSTKSCIILGINPIYGSNFAIMTAWSTLSSEYLLLLLLNFFSSYSSPANDFTVLTPERFS